MTSAQSMEREALALSPDGIPCDVSYANVRRLDAGVSRSAEDQHPREAEQLAQLMRQARVTQYAHLLAELGALLSERGPGDRRFGRDNADRAAP